MKIDLQDRAIFQSLAEFATLAEENAERIRNDASYTGESKEDSLRFLRTGNPARVVSAQALADKILIDIQTERIEWQNDVAGAYPDVPAFLAGQPDCMRRRVQTEDERGPVRVFCDSVAACGLSFRDLEKRGTAAAALVMALVQAGRAVELWGTSCVGSSRPSGRFTIAVRMPTAPFDVSKVAHCLASASFGRAICYDLGYKFGGFNGGWPRGFNINADAPTRAAKVRECLGDLCGPRDLVLPPPTMADTRDLGPSGLIFRNPAQWVSDQIAACNAPA